MKDDQQTPLAQVTQQFTERQAAFRTRVEATARAKGGGLRDAEQSIPEVRAALAAKLPGGDTPSEHLNAEGLQHRAEGAQAALDELTRQIRAAYATATRSRQITAQEATAGLTALGLPPLQTVKVAMIEGLEVHGAADMTAEGIKAQITGAFQELLGDAATVKDVKVRISEQVV